MTRRAALLGMVFGAGAIFTGYELFSRSSTDHRPNVIVVTSDDMSRSDLGSYGNTFIDTPNLDRLATQSMKFNNFYAAPLCSPTRASFETGLYSVKTGITDHLPGFEWPYSKLYAPPTEAFLLPEFDTIAETFSEAGYDTAQFGKWHLEAYNENWQISNAQAHGYETFEFSGFVNKVLRRITGKTRLQRWVEKNGDVSEPNTKIYLTDFHAELGAEFIKDSASSPFFMVVSFNDPHLPLVAQPKYIEKYTSRSQEVQEERIDPVYAAMIEQVDRGVGTLLDAVAESGIEDETIVVFFSDNGGLEMPFWDPDRVRKVTSNDPFRGQKGTLFEGGIRVPFFVRWPDIIPTAETDEIAWVGDLFPTLTNLAGIEVDDHEFDGMDISEVFTSNATAPDRALFFHLPHYHNSPPSSAILRDNYKLIVDIETDGHMLFDLEEDPYETTDLSEQLPILASALKLELRQWWSESGAVIPKPNQNYDADRESEYFSVVR